MSISPTVFSQLIEFLPHYEFQKCVKRYRGSRKVKKLSCWDQYLSMFFAQLTHRESLRDIETCLATMQNKLYHMGIRHGPRRNTLANANENRDWRIFADFAQILIHKARSLYINEDFGIELDNTVYALDSTTIDLCLSLFPWAEFRKTKGAVKMHTLLDIRGSIPAVIHITEGKVHDVNILDDIIPEPGSFYIMDRAYVDFARLYAMHQAGAFFVVRAKSNLQQSRLYSSPVDKSTGLRSDHVIKLTGIETSKDYPEKLRRVRFYDAEHQRYLSFLTNNFILAAIKITLLYKLRWRVELFFRWIKMHLRIKAFFGTTENAVKTQIWIAISVYVLVAIMKKELKLEAGLYRILQILSVTPFEKKPILQLFMKNDSQKHEDNMDIQLSLFDL